nr:unnamed protein product [Callosobruchus analis]
MFVMNINFRREENQLVKNKQIELEKDTPMIIHVKEDYHEETPYEKVDISKKLKRRSLGATSGDELVTLWPEGKPISEAKLADLKSIRHLIPADA